MTDDQVDVVDGKIDVGALMTGGGDDDGPDREEMVASYLPDQDDWAAKTSLEQNDDHAVAVLSILGDLYPEVDNLQSPINQFLDVYLKSRTSIQNQSRIEYQRIFESMWGGHSGDDDARGAIAKALAGDEDDD